MVFGHMQVKFVEQSKMKNEKGQALDDVIRRSLVVSNGTSGEYSRIIKYQVYIYIYTNIYIY